MPCKPSEPTCSTHAAPEEHREALRAHRAAQTAPIRTRARGHAGTPVRGYAGTPVRGYAGTPGSGCTWLLRATVVPWLALGLLLRSPVCDVVALVRGRTVVARSPLRDGASRGAGCQGRFAALRARTSSTLDTHHLGQGRTQLRGSALTCELHPGDSVRPGGSCEMFGPPLIPSARVEPGSGVAPSGPAEVAKPCPVTGFPAGIGGFCRSGWGRAVGLASSGGVVRSAAGLWDRYRSTGRYRSNSPLSAVGPSGWMPGRWADAGL